ncbi:MAG: hypothetical protein ACRDU0_01520, partial [Mycobacterium sp.]
MPANGTTLIPWIVDLAGADANGGTSSSVLATATDGVTNGTNTLTSASAAWTTALIGHGIQWGANWRIVTAVGSATSLTFSGATVATATGQTYVIGGALRTINKVAGLAAGPLAAGDVIAVAPSPLHYREAVTLGQSGTAVGGAITGVSTAVPAVVTTTSAHGLLVGQYVFITGVVGSGEINGVHKVTAVGTTTTYTIDNAVAASTYTSGGATQQLIALIGDVDASYAGKSGPVTLSGWTLGDLQTTPGIANLIGVAGKSGWLLRTLTLLGGTSRCLNLSTAGSQWIGMQGCTLIPYQVANQATVDCQATLDTALHLLFDRCLLLHTSNQNTIAVTAPTTTAANDYDLDVWVQNSVFIGNSSGGNHLSQSATGANAKKPGGVRCRNSSFTTSIGAIQTDANGSVIYPLTLFNCLAFGSSGSQLLRLGQDGNLSEDYNLLQASIVRGGIGTLQPGSASVQAATQAFEADQTTQIGSVLRPYLSPAAGSIALGFGNTELAVSGGSATLSDDATIGAVAWTSPGNAGYPDAVYASAALTSGQDSHYLNGQGFGFAIPGNAVIDGVRVEVRHATNNFGTAAFTGGAAGLKLLKAGVISGNNHTDTSTIVTAANYHTFGGHGDLWGVSLTPADVNAAGFGVVVALHATGTVTAQIDYVRMMVYYHFATPVFAQDVTG